jgi:hypothetical protein
MPAPPGRALLEGAAGKIEVASQVPEAVRAVAVIAHPHPLFGGTMDNKVVTTLARAFVSPGAPLASTSAALRLPRARTARAAAKPTTWSA